MIFVIAFALCLCRSNAYTDVYTQDRNSVECGAAYESGEECPCDNGYYAKIAKKLVTAQVAITFMWKEGGYRIYWCTGFLVTRRHFLTAAMCLYNDYPKDIYQVRIGSTDFRKGQVYEILEFKIHEDYMVGGKRYDDIALVTLNEAVKDPNIGILCLPDEALAERNLTNRGLSAAGWGQNRREDHVNTTNFHLTTMSVISNEECDQAYSEWSDYPRFKPWYPEGMIHRFMCAYYYESEKYACAGDAGRSLSLHHEGRWYAMGILAFGNGCDTKQPIAFTRVASYLDWIRTNIQSSDARLLKENV